MYGVALLVNHLCGPGISQRGQLRTADGYLYISRCRQSDMSYSVAWVVWLQAVILFLLLLAPGDLYNAIPVYISQGYLLVAVSYDSSAASKRTAAALHIAAAVAAAVSAYSTAYSTHTMWDAGRAYVHLGVMAAVAVIMGSTSVHLMSKVSAQEMSQAQ